MEKASDLILVLDSNCDVYYANQAFLKCLKVEAEEILGLAYGRWVNQMEAERMAECCRQVEESVLNGTFDVRLHLKSGEERVVELSSTSLSDGDEALGCLCIGRDVSEHRIKERLLDGLHQADYSISESQDLKEMLRNIVMEATRIIGFDRTDVWLYDPKKRKLRGSYGIDEAGRINDQSDVFKDLNDFPAPYHAVMRGEIPYYSSNRLSDEPVLSGILRQLDVDIRACAVAPLRSEGRILGFISADNRWTGRPIDGEQMEALLSLSRQASLAVAHAQLYEETQYLAESLRRQIQLFCGVFHAGQMVSDSGGLNGIVQQVIQQVRSTLGFDRAAIWLYDSGDRTLRGLFGTNRRGEMTDESDLFYFVDKIKKEWVSIINGENEYILIQDYDHHYQSSDDLTDMSGVKQHLTVPLKAGGRILGLLFADNLMTQRLFDDKTIVPALQLFAGFAASAILYRLELKEALRANRERERALQLEAVIATIRRVNHEINNPLQAIVLNLEMMGLEKDRGTGITARRLDILNECCERLKGLTSRLASLIHPVFEETPVMGRILDLEESVRVASELEIRERADLSEETPQ